MENNLQGMEMVKYLFEVDSDDRYIRLIIPYEFIKEYKANDIFHEDINMIGKKRTELTLDEIVALKKYHAKLLNKYMDKND